MKLCTACHRHVRPSEATCPFCGQALRTAGALPPRAVLLLGALGVACTDRPIDSTSATETSTSSSSTTSSPTSSTSTTTSTSSTSSTSSSTSTGELSSSSDPTTGDSGCAFYGGCPTDFSNPILCDPWTQDCADGEKCVPTSASSLDCVPVDPDAVGPGQPCTSMGFGVDTCAKGSVCFFVDPDTQMGTCVAQCVGSPQDPSCTDPSTACVQIGDVYDLCPSICDPLAQDCPISQVCMQSPDTPDFVCIPDASGPEGQAFDACFSRNECDPGLVCSDPAAATECDPDLAGCCLPYCDTTEPPTCPGVGQECVLLDALPMGFKNIGLCQLP